MNKKSFVKMAACCAVLLGATLGAQERGLAATAASERQLSTEGRAALPAGISASERAFHGPSLRAKEALRQIRSQARQEGKRTNAGHYHVLFKPSAFPFERVAANGARHAVAADGGSVMDKVAETLPGWADSVTNVYSSIGGFSALLTAQQATALSARSDVAAVSEDRAMRLHVLEDWYADVVNKKQIQLDGSLPQYSGAGVHVYVVDTGVDRTHGEFAGATLSANSASLVPDTEPGYNSALDVDPWVDRGQEVGGTVNGHGTAVASLVVGQTHGLAKSAILHSVKFSGSGHVPNTEGFLASLNWILGHRELPGVVNVSVTTDIPDATVNAAVDSLINAGLTVVVSAGNDGGSASDHSPANNPNAIVVGAEGNVRADGFLYPNELPAYTNTGPTVSLFAPGSNMHVARTGLNGGPAFYFSAGTSLAAPVVASIACHYLQTHTTAPADDVKASLLTNAATNVLVQNPAQTSFPAGTANLFVYTGREWIDPNVIIVAGSGALVAQDVDVGGGVKVDQVAVGSSGAIQFHADGGQVTRCSWIDENDDIVQLELSGAGQVVVTLVGATGPAAPVKYNQTFGYMKGKARIWILGSASNTNLSIYTVGRANTANQSLFKDTVTYDGRADVEYLLADARSLSVNTLRLGNTYFHTETDGTFTGIFMPQTKVLTSLVFFDIKSTGGTSPAQLTLSDASPYAQYGRPVIAGGTLTHSGDRFTQINSNPFTTIYTNGNADSHGRTIPAQPLNMTRFLKVTGTSGTRHPVTYSTQNPGAAGLSYTGTTRTD